MKKIILFLAFALCALVKIIAQTGYVGETIYLNPPSVYGTLGGAAWISSNSNHVSVSGGTGGASATINEYFTGEVTIDCQYAYSYPSGGKIEYGNGHAYYYISCLRSTATISAHELSLGVGESADLSYSNSSGYELPFHTWHTDNKSIANFDGRENTQGKTVTLTAQKPGNCTITFYGNCGSDPVTCKVTVMSVEATGMKLSPERVSIGIGQTSTVSPIFTPSNATPTLTWLSSNTNIATVSSSGVVKGISKGNATISAKTGNGITAETVVEVLGRPESISLPEQMTIRKGESASIDVTYSPSNTYTQLTWHCNPSTSATISNNIIKGLEEGIVSIYCTSENNVQSNVCTVTIKGPRATGITLSSESLTVPIGQEKSLTYTLSPSNADVAISWKSSNPAIATVSSDGIVTGIKQGETNISVCTDNGLSATCKVIVPPNPQSIKLDMTNIELLEGSTSKLKYTVVPSDAYYTLSWISTNENIVKVSDFGKLIAQNIGKCDIKVITSNGKEAVCHALVVKEDTYLTVWQSNGEISRFHFNTSPRIKYHNGQFQVNTKEIEVSYSENDVMKFTIDNFVENQDTHIEDISIDNNFSTFSIGNGLPGEHVSIYNLNGQLLDSVTVGVNGDLRYSLDRLQEGYYIVKIGKASIKIKKNGSN